VGVYQFRLPDIGEGVAEAEIVAWHVKPGDRVKEDQSLVDVMTDKATVDISSPVTGVAIAVFGEVGKKLPVGSVLIELEVEGAGNTAEAKAEPTPVIAPAPPDLPKQGGAEVEHTPAPVGAAPVPGAAPVAAPVAVLSTRSPAQGPFAAPATRRRAHQLGIPLQYVTGTGPAGRVTPQDLQSFIAARETSSLAPVAAAKAKKTGVGSTPIIGLRRRIAEKMSESKRRIPHITYVEECDLTELEGLRLDLNAHRAEGEAKLTLLPFIMRALVKALVEYPQVNSRYDDEEGVLHSHEGIHIGIATQTPGGLMVPVVRHAEALNLRECAAEVTRLSQAARTGSIARAELTGSTITITSLGPLGGIVTTPVINHPEVAIIGPNKLVDRPVVDGSFISVRKMMNLSSAFDHRIIDGYEAALFVQKLKRLLEHPALIFME
jgi:2-oxoisovalerate dehydrogenase E2 component (dihydrolipoyl transacylase)